MPIMSEEGSTAQLPKPSQASDHKFQTTSDEDQHETHDLTAALRKLTEGGGVRSARLHTDLGPELRQLFYVPEWDADALRTLARVTWHIDRLIRTQLVGDDLQLVARVSYNLGTADTQPMKLGERRNWLYLVKHGPSPSESQRDLRNIVVPAFVASLLREQPPRPSDQDIAALMATESNRPATDYLPFPTGGEPPETGPPAPDRSRNVIGVASGGLIIIVVSLILVAVAAVVLSTVARNG